jgi:hypothetical protein
MIRRFVSSPIQKTVLLSRKMAHDAKEPPKTGIEGFVAKYLPKNHHVCNFNILNVKRVIFIIFLI